MKRLATTVVAGLMAAAALAASEAPAVAGMNRDGYIQSAYSSHPKDRGYWQWRNHRGGWGHRGWYGGQGGGVAAATIFGLAAGAVVGSAIAADASPWDAHQQACFRLYRSYDPASDTFLGLDGNRYQCTAF